MKQNQYPLGIFTGATTMLLAVQSVQAADIQITGIQLQPNSNGIQLQLNTKVAEGVESAKPQIFTQSQGKNLVADIPNTQLELGTKKSFRQEFPFPGIASVEVSQGDNNNIRVTVVGEKVSPQEDVIQQDGKIITLSFSPGDDSQEISTGLDLKSTEAIDIPASVAQVPTLPDTSSTQEIPTTTTTNNNPEPEVLFPNPEIRIEGNPASAANPLQPIAPTPPFLPRAVAPPVGDIAVSTIDASASYIDLGTAARVPRLVLREAPVREVLQLLARTAGLNVVYSDQGGAAGDGGDAKGGGQTISLDLENEPVQDVFNSVLLVSGMQANRRGNTIFVGAKLPQAAKNIIARSFRLNQVPAASAANFMVTLGAVAQIPFNQVEINTVGEGAAARTVETSTPTILSLTPTIGAGQGEGPAANAPLLLDGLTVNTDDRLNVVTIVGEPRKVEIATALLTQLDARKRQVAVNVKIVDVNLLNTEDYNTSFSFGIGDTYFIQDEGSLLVGFGSLSPATRNDALNSRSNFPVVENPNVDATLYLDPNSTIAVPGTAPGLITTVDGIIDATQSYPNGTGYFFKPTAALGSDPTQALITDITRADPTLIDVTNTFNEATGTFVRTATTTLGTDGEITTELPSLLQYPDDFLMRLQFQVTNGNAKILTDPTLIIQEGQTSSVSLSQEVLGGLKGTGVGQFEPIIKKAGLTLDVNVEGIDDNGFVTMGVNPTVSSPASSVPGPAGQGSITLLQERALTTGAVRVRDGQTLILAGIIQDNDRTTVSKVPILGDIPILGILFRKTSRTNQRNEVIVLLTPHILDDTQQSGWGYNYVPGRAASEVLDKNGFPVQGDPLGQANPY